MSSAAATALASPNPLASQPANTKKRVLADSDTEQRDLKRTKAQGDLVENELKKETKDKKRRRKKKRKVPVVLAQGTPDAEAGIAPEASGSRSRSRSMTLAITPEPDERPDQEAIVTSLCVGPSEAAPRGPSPSHSSSSKGKGRATPDYAAVNDGQQQIADLQGQISVKSNLVTQHETLLSTFQQSLSCQICLDLMHKPFALAPCGHSACHQCLVNWFKAPPPDVPAHDVLPVWLRKKTCPHCRTAVRDRPIEVWTIKDMVATLVKSGLAPAPLLPLPPPPEEGAANVDPWSGIFRPANRNLDLFPEGQPPELMQQLMGLRDDEDGGIYRCLDCHHEIEDGACSQCGRIYPGHNPLGHDQDALDDEVLGHWGDGGIWTDSGDEDDDDDSVADGLGGWGHLEMLRQLFMPNHPGDDDSDSLYSVESRHYDEDIDLEAEGVVFRPALPLHRALIEDAPDGEDAAEQNEEGYESSFIDDGAEERPLRRRAPSVDLDRDSAIDLSEEDEEAVVDDREDDVEFVGFGRRRGGPAARGRATIVITSEDEEGRDASASEPDAGSDDGDLAAEVAAREYDMYGDDGSVPRRSARYDDVSDEDGEGFDDEYSS